MQLQLRFVSLFTIALAALTAGCSPTPTREPQVIVAAPVQRLDLPEKPSRWFSAGFDAGSAGTRVVLADDQTVTTPAPEQARYDDHHGAGGIWLEAYPVSALGIGVTLRNAEGDDGQDYLPLRGRLKLHVVDTDGVSVALTGAYGERSYSYLMNHVEYGGGFFDNGHLVDDAVTTIESSERDFALVAGFRPADPMLIFGGPFLYQQPYRGTHVDYAPAGDGGPPGSGGSGGCGLTDLFCDDAGGGGSGSSEDPEPVTTTFADRVEMRGFNAGIAINLGIPELRLIAEVASARIATGGRSDDTVGWSLAFRGDFGGRL